MTQAADQHIAWMARSFGRPDYLPLGPDDLRLLQDVAEKMTRQPRSHLFREGERAHAAYLVEDGEVELYRTHSGRPRVIARIGPGSVLGDIAMFGEGRYISSARAVGRVAAVRFERESLIPQLARHPALCLRWLVAGLRQLEDTQRRIIHLMHKTVLAQVADLLAEESRRRGDRIPLTQAAMATLLGTTRQSVNEALGELRRRGAVNTGYGSIEVLDADALASIAGSDAS